MTTCRHTYCENPATSDSPYCVICQRYVTGGDLTDYSCPCGVLEWMKSGGSRGWHP